MHQIFKALIVVATAAISGSSWAQSATLKGKVIDEEGNPIKGVIITSKGITEGTQTDSFGNYSIIVPSGIKLNFRADLDGFENNSFNKKLSDKQVVEFNFSMSRYNWATNKTQSLDTALILDKRHRNETGMLKLDPKGLQNLPGGNGIEGLLKVLVGTNNELTNQYSVRGGNYDENIVYVNDFEINRPFLVRSGQQEGLSFVNTDLVKSVNFSVGGFQAKYGDKLSSVLDVTYKTPKEFGGSVLLSLLGFQAHLEGSSQNNKLTYLVGLRQKSNQYLLQSQQTKGQYNPSFTDFQALINYRFSDRWEMEVIGNYARNRFTLQPKSKTTAFGGIGAAFNFQVNYEGNEIDQFDNLFGGWSLTFRPNEKTKLKLLASTFASDEQERFDINGEYLLSQVELNLGSENLGQNAVTLGSGEIHRFARNYLNAQVTNIGHRGSYDINKHLLSWGADYNYISVDDRMLEWERRDSAGFSIPNSGQSIDMYSFYKADNVLDYSRISAFIQDNIVLNKDMTLSVGVRGNYTFLNEEMLISPRAQYSFSPDWERDIIFKLSAGMYAQPIFYREMRDVEGNLNKDLKAQKSFQVSGGIDYNFKSAANRLFNLTTELYYKNLWDIVPYEYDDVRIRYAANNNGEGYAYGAEIKLKGELVKDADSWISLGLMKTEQRILDPLTNTYSEFHARPTDRLMNLGMYFSDYLPQNKNFKLFLNLMYATGLPTAPIGKFGEEKYMARIPDYKRVDIGFSALLLDGSKQNLGYYNLFKGMKSIWLSFEVFNLLGIQNTLSYQYITAMNGDNTFNIPNRLTGTLLNLKLAASF